MSKVAFGTDGIRGRANEGALTPIALTRLGLAISHALGAAKAAGPIYIGRDTRRSGQMVESALIAGLTAGGCDIVRLGIVPTPAIGLLTRLDSAALGIMITASHNPAADNGVKLFGPDGYKIDDALQARIVAALNSDLQATHAAPTSLGSVSDLSHAGTRYIDFVTGTLSRDTSADKILAGLKIVFDGAHGAGAQLGGPLLRDLGADVIEIGTTPDGVNINAGVGSVAPDALIAAVKSSQADLGLALDGDADRILLVDETGQAIDGDQILAVLAQQKAADASLKSGAVIATVMSNLGLETYLSELGIDLSRTPVGDRYVVQEMRSTGANLGGESSGHIILGDYVTTGDALLTAVHTLDAMRRHGGPASQALNAFTPAPQLLINVRYGERDPTDSATVQSAIRAAEARLGEEGRVLIRKSGTEPVIRIMVEALDSDVCKREAEALAELVRAEAAR